MASLPDTPPPFATLLAQASQAGRLMSVIEIMAGAGTAAGAASYLHWDDLLHRDPPAGLTREEWWLGLRIQRQFKRTPLRSTTGLPFTYAPVDSMQKMLASLDRLGAGRHELGEEIANPAVRDRYLFLSVSEEAIASSLLEGAAVTRVKAKELLRTGRKPRTAGERMIAGNFAAMQFLLAHQGEPLTPEFVLELHRILSDGSIEPANAAGRFRREDELVRVYDSAGEVVHVPPPAAELSDRLGALCRFANEGDPDTWHHPIVCATLLHLWLAYDHPFVDGNGRTARALFYWAMLKHGYWLFEFISVSRLLYRAPAKYARSFLLVETDGFDATYFILEQLRILQRAIEDLWTFAERKEREVRASEQRLHEFGVFNHRQLALLSHALRRPDTVFTIRSHRRSHDVAYATARADLMDLAERGLLHPGKRGRTLVYTPTDELLRRK
jgi:Fic family protein